ncbi:hypothetical protein [Aestuariivirga sp.]|jgi:hypothetical protein|uniref:hypothetical protein n=1 Tax=Aestuariivirga sp. TaxID=2650926 RepID=UPI003783C917
MDSLFTPALKAMLRDYYEASFGPVILEVDKYLKAQGIDPKQTAAHAGIASGFHCILDDTGLFHFDHDGEKSLVFEVLDEDAATTIDLCAFSIVNPDRFGTAMGNAPLLGMTNITNPASWTFGKKLHVHRRPLEWLKAGCSGTVILDHLTAPSFLSRKLGDLLAEDADHARELGPILCTPLVDRNSILFPKFPARRAA